MSFEFPFLPVQGHVKSLDQFEYADSDIADIITSCTSNLSFLGLTGQVQFDSSGDPTKNIKIDQIQGKCIHVRRGGSRMI